MQVMWVDLPPIVSAVTDTKPFAGIAELPEESRVLVVVPLVVVVSDPGKKEPPVSYVLKDMDVSSRTLLP